MHKLTTAVLMLAPALAFAHPGNDLSHGASHWAFSWHHLLGMITLTIAGAVGIYFFTKPKPEEPKKARVRVSDRHDH